MRKRDAELRNTKSEDIEEVKSDVDAYTPKNAVIIKTKKPIDKTIKEILSELV